ncbi:MAG: MBL fold metallo-hydrolase [Candidatus Aenigmatarchaeota archaeon]
MNRIVFLGTGGGRHVMFSQARRTGGLYFELENNNDITRFIIDPGPGSLIYSHILGLHPENWNGILLSHYHVDHSNDVNVILDGIKKPFLIAEEHCIKYNKNNEYPCISKYHKDLVKNLYAVKHGDIINLNNIKIHAIKSNHHAPCVGFKIIHEKFSIGYPSDGSYYSGQEKFYENCDIIILNVLVPKGESWPEGRHMSIDGAISLIKNMKSRPRLCILNHLSFWMMRSNVFKQAKMIQDATKVKTIHVDDFTELNLDDMTIKKFDVNIIVKK